MQKIIFGLLIIIFTSATGRAYAQDADVQDSLALVDLYNSTNGSGWIQRDGWLVGPVNGWYGVNINSGGKVITLNLVGNNLKGTLPASFKNLTAVVDVELQLNQLTGSIPDLTGMVALNTLNLGVNQLTGPLPSSIGTLTNLGGIYLNNNQLSGAVPSLANLTLLNTVELENNKFSGAFPVLPSANNISYLRLSYNNFSGPLPSNIASFISLNFPQYVDLDHNQFTGILPAGLSTLLSVGLYEMNLSNNLFPAPLNITTPGDIQNFIIDSNQFDFTGIESCAQQSIGSFIYSPQFPPMHLHFDLVGPGIISVSAGGTLANNTYYWYRNGALVQFSFGDSTFFYTGCGDKYWVYVVNNYATDLTLYSDTVINYLVPSVTIVASANNICSGTNVTFTASRVNGGTTPAYQWQVNGTNVGTNSATFSSNTLANNDAVTVILTSNDACALPATATSNKITMIVNPAVPLTFDPIGPFCKNATAPALPTTSKEGTAGTWNPAVINTTVIGSSNYIFTPTGAGCSLPATVSITITASQTPTFDPIGPFCKNATAPALPATSKEGTAGTWSPATINTTVVGSSNYIFTPTGGGCSLPATVSITITASQTPTFDPIGPYCQNATAPALPVTSKEGTAGTWSPATINTSVVGASNYIFTPTAGGCSLPATVSITITANQTPTFNPIGPFCQNATAPALPATSKEGTTGTWSPITINTALVGSSNYIFTPTAGGCSLPATVSITITANQTSTFDPIGPLCKNATAPALPATSKEGTAGTWSPATINTSVVGSSNYVFTPTGAGCSLPATVSITIATQVTPTFDPIGPLCKNATAPTLPATSKEGTAGTWSPATINTTVVGSSNYIFTPTVGGCSLPATVSITISTQVTPTFDPIGPFCKNATAPALPATSKEGTAGTWSPATINTTVVGSSNYIFTPTGGGCSLAATVSITINASQTSTFDPIGPLCKNVTAPVLPATSKEGTTGTWSPATINTSVVGASNYVFTPTAGGCSLPATVSITITTSQTPTFDPIGPLCKNATAPALPTTSKEGTTGTWSPSTINTSVVGSSNYIFTPTAGGCSLPATVSITISTQVTPTFDPIGPLCKNATAPALPATSKEGTAGTWSPSTINTSVVGSSNYIFTPTTGGCSLPATVSITISTQVTATFDPIGPLCKNATAPALPATSKEGTTGTWSPSTINTSVVGSSNYVFTPTGGGCSLPATISITITTQVTPTFNPIGPLCQNSTAPALPVTSKEGTTGTWSPATINTSVLGSSNYIFTPTGGGCAIPATVSITISTKVTPTFTQIGPQCQNGSAPSLQTTSTNGVSGTWSPSQITISKVGITTYTFTPSTNQCGTTTTMDVEIKAIPIVKTGPNQTIEAGATVGLTATITGVSDNEISGYLWSPSDGLSNPATINPNASPATTTTYTLDVSTDAGCKGSGSTTITVNASVLPPLGIPNAFSPNGDGINDTWVITNISYYPQADISVFNRYGHLIYQTQGAYTPWDGNYNGTKVPFGTYYYIIDTNTGGKKKSGSVTIFR